MLWREFYIRVVYWIRRIYEGTLGGISLENAQGPILFLSCSVQLLCLAAQNLQPQGNLVHPTLWVNPKVASQ